MRPHEDRTRFVADNPTPRCEHVAIDRHHIFSRVQLGQPADVVRDLKTDERISNIALLCRYHHHQLTGGLGGHAARITYEGGRYLWKTHKGSARPLEPQPSLGEEAGAGEDEGGAPLQSSHRTGRGGNVHPLLLDAGEEREGAVAELRGGGGEAPGDSAA